MNDFGKVSAGLMKGPASTTRSRPSKVDVVFDDILHNITTSGLVSNDILPTERDLAKRFGVSRRVVREALGRLKGLGLVSARTKRGTRVTTCTWGQTLAAQIPFVASNASSLSDLYRLRMAVEIGNALQVVTTVTDQQIAELRRKMDQMTRCQTMAELAPVEADFHTQLLNLSGNPLTVEFGGVIVTFFRWNLEKGPGRYMTPHADVVLKRHKPIVDWLETRDPAGVVEAFREHLDRRIDENLPQPKSQ